MKIDYLYWRIFDLVNLACFYMWLWNFWHSYIHTQAHIHEYEIVVKDLAWGICPVTPFLVSMVLVPVSVVIAKLWLLIILMYFNVRMWRFWHGFHKHYHSYTPKHTHTRTNIDTRYIVIANSCNFKVGN